MTDTPSLSALARAVGGAAEAPGSVLGVRGLVLRLALPAARLGERLRLPDGALLEVVGFDGTEATALALTRLGAVTAGMPVRRISDADAIHAGPALLGRVLDGLGRPIDGGDALPEADWPVRRPAPDPLTRRPVDTPLPLGVRVIDGLCTVGRGQRLALEAGPGAGKTTLLAQIAAQAAADVTVLALIGERGREVAAFLDRLPPAARARTVVVVARADDPPLAWLHAAAVATAIAEWFRADGRDALLLLDSLTRVARAIRTVGVAAGEPVARRGYPPSLSTTIQQLLERAANDHRGTLTALYAVLVEGDAAEDPVAEEARALLDGHLVLDPALAGASHFPAVDLARSVSRCLPALADPEHARAAASLRRWLAAGARHRDLIAVGAYQRGADPDADAWLAHRDAIDAFLRQPATEAADYESTLRRLTTLVR